MQGVSFPKENLIYQPLLSTLTTFYFHFFKFPEETFGFVAKKLKTQK